MPAGPLPEPGGLDGLVQDGALALLDEAACHLGSSREELALALRRLPAIHERSPPLLPQMRTRGYRSAVPLDEVTQLLRTGDPSLVEADLVDLLLTAEEEWVKDSRDLMMALAPHHDCARRLGADVPALFRRAAAAGPASLRERVEEFGRRRDVSPQAFGFCVEETPEGLRYRWGSPSGEDTLEQLRRAGILDEDHFD